MPTTPNDSFLVPILRSEAARHRIRIVSLTAASTKQAEIIDKFLADARRLHARILVNPNDPELRELSYHLSTTPYDRNKDTL